MKFLLVLFKFGLILSHVLFSVEAKNSPKLPNYIQRCHLKDTELDKCLEKNIGNALKHVGTSGIPELKVPSLEPVKLEKLVIKAGTSAVSFDQHYFNVSLYGLQDCMVSDVKMDVGNNILNFTLFGDLIQKGQYEISGKVMVMPVFGSGDSIVKFLKTKLTCVIKFKEEIKKEKKYFMLDDLKLTINVTDRVVFSYDNLFNGDKTLSDTIHKVANDNWRDIVGDVIGAIEYAYSTAARQGLAGVFDKIPMDELFLIP